MQFSHITWYGKLCSLHFLHCASLVELNQFVVDDQVIKKNKLKGIMEMIINLDELNNSDNLEEGHPSNALFTYHVTDDKDFTCFETQTLQYRKF